MNYYFLDRRSPAGPDAHPDVRTSMYPTILTGLVEVLKAATASMLECHSLAVAPAEERNSENLIAIGSALELLSNKHYFEWDSHTQDLSLSTGILGPLVAILDCHKGKLPERFQIAAASLMAMLSCNPTGAVVSEDTSEPATLSPVSPSGFSSESSSSRRQQQQQEAAVGGSRSSGGSRQQLFLEAGAIPVLVRAMSVLSTTRGAATLARSVASTESADDGGPVDPKYLSLVLSALRSLFSGQDPNILSVAVASGVSVGSGVHDYVKFRADEVKLTYHLSGGNLSYDIHP